MWKNDESMMGFGLLPSLVCVITLVGLAEAAADADPYSQETENSTVIESETETEEEPAPLIKEADPEFEKLLDEEDAIEASTREQSETPHFRAND